MKSIWQLVRTNPRRSLLVVVVSLLTYLVGTAAIAGIELSRARTEIDTLLNDTPDSKVELQAAISTVSEKLTRADIALSGPIWWAVSATPIVGSNPAVVREITSSSRAMLNELSPLVKSLNSAEKLQLDKAFLDQSSQTVDELVRLLESADIALASSSDLLLLPIISEARQTFREQLSELKPVLLESQSLLDVAPLLFGTEQPTEWIVVFANGAEARPAGGFPGGWGIITAQNGQLKLTDLESNDRLSRSSVAGWAEIAGPEAAALYGADLSRVLDMGLSPDFEISGSMFYHLYTQQTPNRRPVGVLQFDEHALAYLLELTGPVSLPNGKSLDAVQAVDYITRQVYFDYPDVAEKDAVLLGIARDIFRSLNSTQSYDLEFVNTMLTAIKAQRVRAWVNDPEVQSSLRKTSLGGKLRDLQEYSHALAIANGGGNKLEAYFEYELQYQAGRCRPASGYREATLSLEIANTAPAVGLPAYVTPRTDLGQARPVPQGGTREILYFHLPAGTTVKGAKLDGVAFQHSRFGTENGRDVYRFDVEVSANTTRTLELKVLEFALDGEPLRNFWLSPMPKPVRFGAITPENECFRGKLTPSK